MSRRKHVSTEHKHSNDEPDSSFSFQLSLSGIVGIAVVLFCLFLWMFLIGIWAGQTILYPPSQPLAKAAVSQPPSVTSEETRRPAKPLTLSPEPEPLPESEGVLILPRERKRRIAPPNIPIASPAQ